MLKVIWDDFTWHRPTSRKRGFTWEVAGDDMRLVDLPGAAFTDYRPGPAIFRDFADLERTPKAVLNFANRYGPLCQRLEFNSLSDWRTGIQHMRELVALGDAVTVGNWKRIPQVLEPFLTNPSLANTPDIRLLREQPKRGRKISLTEQAHAAVMRLYQAISPVERLVVEGTWNSLTKSVELRLKAADLRSFMFVQLGDAVIGGRRFRQCLVCGKWSLLTPGVNRSDRTTCSAYCRLKRYRQRRARAAELHHKGWPLGKIAEEIGSHLSNVKRWISQENG